MRTALQVVLSTALAAMVLAGCGRSCSGSNEPRPSAGTAPSTTSSSTATTSTTSGGSGSTAAAEAVAAPSAKDVERARALAAVARSVAERTPRDHEDFAVVVQHTGPEPQSILRWVRENTRHLAYAGMLRGGAGVLMDRAGNSLDRALFTAELMKRAGHQVRVARATLPKTVASALRASLAASSAAPQPSPPPDAAELGRKFASVPVSPADLQRAIAATVQQRRTFDATMQELQAKVGPALEAALGPSEARDAAVAAEAERVLADHFWVQRQAANNYWEDFDPDGAAVGRLTPTATFAPEQVPEDLKHRVVFRISFERLQEQRLSQETVLERGWVAADLLGKTLTFRHRLFPQIQLDKVLASPNPREAYAHMLADAWIIEPFVLVGSDEVTDRLYTLRGEAMPAGPATRAKLGISDDPLSAMGSKMAGGFAQPFGGPAAPEPAKAPDEAAAPVKIVAEWLEIEIRVPGRPAELHRRAVFDLLGPAARASGKLGPPSLDQATKERRALALGGDIGAIVAAATPNDDWLSRLTGQRLAATLEQGASIASSAQTAMDRSEAGLQEPLQLPLWSWAASRAHDPILPPAVPVAPNVALLWLTPTSKPSMAEAVKVALDVVSNATGGELRFGRRLAQGLRDTVTERAVLGSSRDVANAAVLHAADLAGGRAWVRLEGATAGADALELSAEAKARIREDLKAGYLVLARSRTTSDMPFAAWWRIDPKSGTAIGMGENGLGAAVPERVIIARCIAGGVCLAMLAAEISHLSAWVMGAFCLVGAGTGHGVGAIVGEGAIDLLLHLIMAEEPPGGGGH